MSLQDEKMKTLRDYEGRAIRLTDERLAHILEHPEMQGMEDRIAETLLRPERVMESLSDPMARLYYRMYVATRVGDKHLCVVVKMADNDAFVLTAYLMTNPARGRQLWPKRS
ncbi:MAG: hypothetical protein AB7O31_11880 [Burkholderiales bacterium]